MSSFILFLDSVSKFIRGCPNHRVVFFLGVGSANFTTAVALTNCGLITAAPNRNQSGSPVHLRNPRHFFELLRNHRFFKEHLFKIWCQRWRSLWPRPFMIFYGARSILVVIQAWPGCRWMHCLDRNSSSLLGVRILSLIGHGSKNRRQKPQICLGKKMTQKTTLGASHSHVLSFQIWVMPNQWTVIRYLAKFQAETCGRNRQIASNTHVHQLFD